MAPQPSRNPRSPPAAGLSLSHPERPTADRSPERQLQYAVRLATALLHAPIARLYARGPSGTVAVATSRSTSSEGLGSDPAPQIAADLLRSGGATVRWLSTTSLQPPDSHRVLARQAAPTTTMACIGAPILSPSGEVAGALVVADGPERRWNERDIESLSDLASLVGDVLGHASRRASDSPVPAPRAADAVKEHPRPQPDPVTGRGRVGGNSAPGAAELFSEAGEANLVEIIRQSIVGSLHLGALRAGDRLPSIRHTARAFSVTPYMVLQAYAELELEGLVERRERSGVFVADFETGAPASLPETGAWLTEVLTQACQHQVKIPLLPDLIRRWTNAGRIRCACVESCFDSRFSLAVELSQQFGIQPRLVSAEITRTELRDTDLVITTAYQAAEIGPMVAEARKPMLIATVNPLILSSALNHLRERDLTVICVDPVYGARLRALQGGAYRERVRVITTEDAAGLSSLDRSEAVLLTPAARQRLAQPDFRLVAPVYPAYSLDFARKVAESLVRINLRGSRA